jgi:Na+-translocating ferredoxin:NAD+ oxidoreductase RnfC subunit
MKLEEKVKQAGVVGAGGGGFPTHVKLAAQADTVIANGAECEPLLHKDAVVMERHADQVVAGVRLVMEAVGARDGVIAIKAKKQAAITAITQACRNSPVKVQLLGDYYPAGDEYDLVYSVTGRLIPPAGIPLQVGVVVSNVETFANISAAADDVPVTQKTLTVAGAVRQPVTITVPLGARYRDCIELAGGLTTPDPVLFIGGLMMGPVCLDLDAPVTKTTTGLVVLPRSHPVAVRKLKPAPVQNRIGKSACDQCRYCTEFCPRFLLGYAVEPHQVMRSLAFTASGQGFWDPWAALCCACGLCTLYACPEELFPKEACDQAKMEMRKANLKWSGPATVKVHPMREGRHVPIKSLIRKLHLQEYDLPTPYLDRMPQLSQVVLPLKQSAGTAANPCVKPGDTVKPNQLLASIPDGALGAALHAPFSGIITEANREHLVLRRNS